jgi:hypothetical protein
VLFAPRKMLMNYKILTNAACVAFVCGTIAAVAQTSQSNQPMQQNMQPMSPPMQSPVDCTGLSSKEQIFANQMADMNNRSMFCAKMTPDQRKQVMDSATKPNASGFLMTSDQAMQQYMQQNNMLPPAPAQRSGGACPVK